MNGSRGSGLGIRPHDRQQPHEAEATELLQHPSASPSFRTTGIITARDVLHAAQGFVIVRMRVCCMLLPAMLCSVVQCVMLMPYLSLLVLYFPREGFRGRPLHGGHGVRYGCGRRALAEAVGAKRLEATIAWMRSCCTHRKAVGAKRSRGDATMDGDGHDRQHRAFAGAGRDDVVEGEMGRLGTVGT